MNWHDGSALLGPKYLFTWPIDCTMLVVLVLWSFCFVEPVCIGCAWYIGRGRCWPNVLLHLAY